MLPGLSGAGSNAAGVLFSIKGAPLPPEDIAEDLRAVDPPKPLGPCPSGSPFAKDIASPRLRWAEKVRCCPHMVGYVFKNHSLGLVLVKQFLM